MSLYILKMDNPGHPLDTGVPTRVRLIGPFACNADRIAWSRDRANNPSDNPCWHHVDLDAPVVRVVAP